MKDEQMREINEKIYDALGDLMKKHPPQLVLHFMTAFIANTLGMEKEAKVYFANLGMTIDLLVSIGLKSHLFSKQESKKGTSK